MEERVAKMIFNKPGGTAGKGAYTTRVTIPSSWAKAMGITNEERSVKISFDGEKVVIEKV